MRIAATSSELKVANPLFDYVRIINHKRSKDFMGKHSAVLLFCTDLHTASYHHRLNIFQAP